MTSTGVTITNPLILYRSLLATQKIRPDPAQHRLALHLQNLYERLLDYEPKVQYSQRLQRLSQTLDPNSGLQSLNDSGSSRFRRKGIWTSLLAQKEKRDTLALTRVLTDHEEAMQLESPKGLMLHGEVGTGKSMLIDLFQECLPNRKKRRWHFNTFMLDTTSRLEHLRRSRSQARGLDGPRDEYSLLLVARELIETSPILFLDEFQLPDRVASKILSNLMTSFFQLGGVLIATSNRMPEELAKAAGMEFERPLSRPSRLGWGIGKGAYVKRDDGAGQAGEFGAFLEVLKARCEVWEMEGQKDYRKLEREERTNTTQHVLVPSSDRMNSNVSTASNAADITGAINDASYVALPTNYLIQPSSTEEMETFAQSFNSLVESATRQKFPIPWISSSLIVYGRALIVPAEHNGVAFFTFGELCGAVLGPADYITLASSYHTFILTDVPTMGFQQKEEARRFITLLDAMYEARCRLLITAIAGPDNLFFPEPALNKLSQDTQVEVHDDILRGDAVHPETYSEIYQDLHSPFRPNISSYNIGRLSADALEDDPPNRMRRPSSSFTDERSRIHPGTPNFADIGGLTGEDEKFAVKRAESRIWEMCSRRWWENGAQATCLNNEGATSWWRPLPPSSRHWERSISRSRTSSPSADSLPPNVKILSDEEKMQDRQKELEDMFARGTSPFRTDPNAPPKFSWTHAWGMVTWGKKAGAWGRGVEGLRERVKERDGGGVVQNDMDEKGKS